MPLVFRKPRKRADHFSDHGADFSAVDEFDYERKADAFLSLPAVAPILEIIRPREGDTIRYNSVTDEFGIISHDGYIRTYYIPDPAEHGYPTNLDYFNAHRNQR